MAIILKALASEILMQGLSRFLYIFVPWFSFVTYSSLSLYNVFSEYKRPLKSFRK